MCQFRFYRGSGGIVISFARTSSPLKNACIFLAIASFDTGFTPAVLPQDRGVSIDLHIEPNVLNILDSISLFKKLSFFFYRICMFLACSIYL